MVAQSSQMTMIAVSRSLLHLRRDQRGIAAVTLAVTLPLLLAFGALAINSGLWFTIKRQNQSAADAAAISAAYEIIANPAFSCPGSTPANVLAAASEAASQNGWTNTGTAPAVDPCYSDALVPSGVAVTLQQDQSSLFAYAPLATATIATKAVAVVKTLADTCILALDSTAQNALSLSNNASLPNANCAVASNSTAANALSLSNNATIYGPVSVVGGWSLSNGAHLYGSPDLQGAAAIPDPYSSLTLPALPNCLASGGTVNVGNNQVPVPLKHYCSWNIGNGNTLTLTAGTYYVDTINAGNNLTINGTGVTIVISSNNQISIGNNATYTITAPSPGSGEPFPGVALMDLGASSGSSGTITQTFNNNGSTNIKGAVYFRNQIVEFSNNVSVSGGCTQIIARIINLSNNVVIDDNCGGVGINPLAIKTVSLAE
jgi:hypothetical protein